MARSKYEEDVYLGNHTVRARRMAGTAHAAQSVWGSYWKNGRWGFGCCHSLEKNSYCLGEQGKVVNDRNPDALLRAVVADDATGEAAEAPSKSLVELHAEKLKAGKGTKAETPEQQEAARKRKLGEACATSGCACIVTVRQALRAQASEEARAEGLLAMDERQRPYNSAKRTYAETTAEELEAYHLKKRSRDDPMAALLDT